MECAPPEVVCEVLVEEVGEEDTHCSSALATLDQSKSILLLPPLPLRFVLLSLSLCELASLRCCMESASQNASRRRTAAAATADASVVAAVVLVGPTTPPSLAPLLLQSTSSSPGPVASFLDRAGLVGLLGATKFWEKMGSDIIGEADVAAAVVDDEDDEEDEEDEALADLGAFLANHFDKPPALDSSWVKLPKESPRVVMGVTRAISRRALAPLRSSDTDRSAFSFSAPETDDDDDDTVRASSEALKPG